MNREFIYEENIEKCESMIAEFILKKPEHSAYCFRSLMNGEIPEDFDAIVFMALLANYGARHFAVKSIRETKREQ